MPKADGPVCPIERPLRPSCMCCAPASNGMPYPKKRSLLTDGAGIPLALVVAGANRHDVKLLSATLDGLVISRPEPTAEQPQYLCLDAGYDSTPVYKELLARR